MRRRTFDTLVSAGGLVLTVVLAVAGVLLFVGYSFANSNVRDQLAAQKITIPAAGSQALADPAIKPYLEKYAGQKLVTGAQAEAYADHFIAVHLKKAGGGLTYAQLSTQAQANPTDTKLAATVQTMFRGETLRGMLLNAYAFWKLGQIALLGSIVAFIVAAIMLVLTILGFWHTRRADPEAEIFAPTFAHKATA